MRRTRPLLLASTALLMMVVGCSSDDSTPTTVTVTEAPTTAPPVASSPAHPTEAAFFAEQFHPCEVFSEEQLQRAGLGERSNAADGFQEDIQTCGFRSSDIETLDGTFLVATDQMNRKQIEELGFDPLDWGKSEIQGMYVHKMPSQVRQCAVAVDYQWGRFLVGYREHGEGWDSAALCSKAALILESLIMEAGRKHGT